MNNRFTQLLGLLVLLFSNSVAWAQVTITGTITGVADKKSLPEAIVILKGSNLGTVADEDGKYTINLPEAKGTLIFTYIGFQSKEVELGSATAIDVALEEGVELNNVMVVGTRNASRTRIESAVPVDIIPVRSVVNEVGQVEINQLLHYAAPSFNTTRQNLWDGGAHLDPASLRGLGTDQVLILVNGKRRHTTAFINIQGSPSGGQAATDMSSIPAYAIERIEILRDGAAAQYGSDAIAGVINIVLRKDVNRFTAAVTSGMTSGGDGLTYAGNANYGMKIGKKGFLNISGEYKNRGAASRTNPWEGPIYNFPNVTDTTKGRDWQWAYNNSMPAGSTKTYKQLDDDKLASLGRTRRQYSFEMGQASQISYGLMANFGLPITENIEIYGFGGFNQKNGVSKGFYRGPLSGRNVPAMYPNGFLPEIRSNIADVSGAIGVRGKLKGWNYDLSNVYGTNSFGYGVGNTANVSREAFIAANPSSGLTPGKSVFDAGAVGFYQNTTNLDFSQHNANLFQGTNFAFGGEFRSDRYTQTKGELDSYRNYPVKYFNGTDSSSYAGGSQMFPGFRNAVDGSRTNISLYGDMEADFTSHLMMGIALRYENYSDFGASQNYKLVAKYKVNKELMFRGASSTGFRAPSAHQINYQSTATLFTATGTPYELGLFPTNSPAAKALGIPALKQETSLNYSLGTGYKPNDDFEVTFDYYSMEIKDRIVLTGEFGGGSSAQDIVITNALTAAGAGSAAFFTNAVNTRTSGVDLVASYHHKFAGNHDMRFVFAGNFNKNEVIGDVATSPLLKGKEDVYFGREKRGFLENGTPQTKITFSINWKHDKMWAMLRNVYFGEISYAHPEGNLTVYNYKTDSRQKIDQSFAPKVVTDLTIGYMIAPGFNFSVGASNLLNIFPDQQKHSYDDYAGQFPYSFYVQQFGYAGAYYFARLAYDLRTK